VRRHPIIYISPRKQLYLSLSSSPNLYALFLPILNVINKDIDEEGIATVLLIFLNGGDARRWRKLKNKGAMYSTRKRRNEKNIDFSAVAGADLPARSYIRYDTLRKALQKTEDAMHALVLIYMYRTSHFSRIIFRTKIF